MIGKPGPRTKVLGSSEPNERITHRGQPSRVMASGTEAERAAILFRSFGSGPTQYRPRALFRSAERSSICSLVGCSLPESTNLLAPLRTQKIIVRSSLKPSIQFSLTPQGLILAECLLRLSPARTRPQSTKRTTGERALELSPSIDPALLEDVSSFVGDPLIWFDTPNPEFEGRRPVDMLGTQDEARLRNRIEAAKLGLFS